MIVTSKLREPTLITVTLCALLDPHGLNKGCHSKFRLGSRVQQETPEEGRRTYRPRRCGNNNKDEDNSPKTLNDKNPSSFVSEIQIIDIAYYNVTIQQFSYYYAEFPGQDQVKRRWVPPSYT